MQSRPLRCVNSPTLIVVCCCIARPVFESLRLTRCARALALLVYNWSEYSLLYVSPLIQVTLLESGETLQKNGTSRLLIVSNYFIDTLPADAYRVIDGKLHGGYVTSQLNLPHKYSGGVLPPDWPNSTLHGGSHWAYVYLAPNLFIASLSLYAIPVLTATDEISSVMSVLIFDCRALLSSHFAVSSSFIIFQRHIQLVAKRARLTSDGSWPTIPRRHCCTTDQSNSNGALFQRLKRLHRQVSTLWVNGGQSRSFIFRL